jgi:hypothetical protein
MKIPLDLGLSAVFTDSRSGQRTSTGAVRMEFRLDPCRSRGAAGSEHGQCSRPPRTGLSDPFGGSAATTSRRSPRETGAGAGSDRARDHLRVVEGNGDLLERSSAARRLAVSGRDSEANEFAGHLRVVGERGSRGEEPKDLGPIPTGPSEVGSDWRQDRGLGQPGQREAVPTGSRLGNRRRVRTRHRPPRRKARRAM